MVSKTSRTKTRRVLKKKKMGRDRKNSLNNHGTTKTYDELFAKQEPKTKNA